MHRLILFFCLISVCLCTQKVSKSRRYGIFAFAGGNSEYYFDSEDDFSSEEYVPVEMCGIHTDMWDAPYQVSIEYRGMTLCGGILIGESYVLTSALCVLDIKRGLEVRVGSESWGEGGHIHFAFDVVTHPKFEVYLRDYDVSIIKLAEPIIVSEEVRPIRLSPHEPRVNTYINKCGWEINCDDSMEEYSPRLLSNNILIISREDCQEYFSEDGVIISETLFCGMSDNSVNCLTKWGGAATFNDELVGISSFKLSCTTTEFPEVFTNIGHLDIRNFILRETGSGSWSKRVHN